MSATLQDREAVAALLGREPTAEFDVVVRRADGSWLLDGALPMDELRDYLPVGKTPPGDYHTLAGLVMLALGRIPTVGDTFDCGGFRFEVVDMDGNRVDKVLVAPRNG